MALNTKQLRIAIAGAGLLLLAVVIGFYGYAKYKVARQVANIPKQLGIDVQESTQGFTFSKSEGGRTLFTISAGKAVRFKQGQRAELESVRIIVYGENNEYDQIFGNTFAYDPESGEVTARGEVLIDLQAQGKPTSDPLKNSEKGRVHFRTSGLSFNQKTGLAQTKERIEFSIPQAAGSARGAQYDSRKRTLALTADVRLSSAQANPKLPPTAIMASHAFIEDQPLRAVLGKVRMEQPNRSLNAEEVSIALRDDNTISTVIASGGVSAEAKGKTDSTLHSQRAEFDVGADNLLKKAVLTGAVSVHATGESPLDGSAGRAVIDFTGRNQVSQARATESVRFEQGGAQQTSVQADVVDFFFHSGGQLQRAVTSGASQITLQQGNQRSVVTARGFEAAFTGKNRMRSLTGAPNARIVTSTPGEADRVIAAEKAVALFETRTAKATIKSIDVQGKVDYREGTRSATAQQGRFSQDDGVLYLEGDPHVEDSASGFSVAARMLRLNRKSGDLTGQGEVKATYRQMKANGSGSILSGSDPIHATSENVVANRNSGVATFTGTARLWQGANMIQAPSIVFDKDRRALAATGNSQALVQTVFVQTDKAGKQLPIQVTAGRFNYADSERKGHFAGGVRVKIPETTLTSAKVEVLLKPKAAGGTGAAQVDQIIATADEGKNVLIEQENPVRRATGERLVYGANESKFVLTGAPGNPPSIFDAERGNLTGDSLTFYTRDDRVQVVSGDSSRTITRTRIKNESKP